MSELTPLAQVGLLAVVGFNLIILAIMLSSMIEEVFA
jgi:hypothetical protein